MLSRHYSTFFESVGDEMHVTAHSHHPWPDVTRAAQLQYWDDSVRLTDRKSAKRTRTVIVRPGRELARRRVATRSAR